MSLNHKYLYQSFGEALGFSACERMNPFTPDQRQKFSAVDWQQAMIGEDEPKDLREFLDSCDVRQLNEWKSAMEEATKVLHKLLANNGKPIKMAELYGEDDEHGEHDACPFCGYCLICDHCECP